jgi:AraC family transcriptional regulator, regulatory protein of adaptative response / DNA-3-methyladenine glycosylase II
VIEDTERCYRAVSSRDQRFDGWFLFAVTSTGIYCRPSCPATTPKQVNTRFFSTAAAAQAAGFRSCRRCRPDAAPGSPEWDQRADVVGRAMRLIADGVVDRDGVGGLATRLGYSERHLHRQLSDELGAGPLALARAQRAHTARLLIETTEMSMTEVAFAAGFSSIRQFNDTVREIFSVPPTALRRATTGAHASSRRGVAGGAGGTVGGVIELNLAVRQPFDAASLLAYFAARAIPGVEHGDATSYCRVLRLPHGLATVTLTPQHDRVRCRLRLGDVRDLTAAVARCRRLLDLDADPVAIAEVLGCDAWIGHFVRPTPGRRCAGAVDGAEQTVRAVLGQQISVAGARTLAGRLAGQLGTALATPDGELSVAFPAPEVLAEAPDELLAMPNARRRTLRTVCGALAEGSLVVDVGAESRALTRQLESFAGIGPWTASYVTMRALSDPDVFLATDLGIRRSFERLGRPGDPRSVAAIAERWRPWRSYALTHLWSVQ